MHARSRDTRPPIHAHARARARARTHTDARVRRETRVRDEDGERSIKKGPFTPTAIAVGTLLAIAISPYQKRIRTQRAAHPADPPLTRATPLSLTSRSLRREIFILIADRLTAAERAFSTPPPSPLGQSARVPPAILVHTDAARTCTVLLFPSSLRRAAHRGGCSLADVCVCQPCVCVCIRARACVCVRVTDAFVRACSSRQSISIREQETREKAAASLTRGQQAHR